MKSIAIALAGVFASVAVAAPPPVPTFTVAATEIKQLQFDVTPVSGAEWYELWFRAAPGAPWVNYTQTSAASPQMRIGASVHLLDWRQARYFVKACNSSGCSQSTTAGVNGQQLAAIGYFKPLAPASNQYFGFNLAVSADGRTMVVLAPDTTTRVWGAAIHVYRKGSSKWRLETRLFPSPNAAGGGYSVAGDPIAISGDGNTVVFANWIENSTTGAVYLFRREAAGWRQSQRIAGFNSSGGQDQFGINVKLDAAGKTLVIARNQPAGVRREGTLEVYQDLNDGSDQFVYATTVPTPPFDDPVWGWCRAIAMSEVGHIVRSCYSGVGQDFYTQVFTAISWAPLQYVETARLDVGTGVDVSIDFKGQRMVVQDVSEERNRVAMFRREATGWVSDGTLTPLTDGVNHSAISGDGRFVAVGSSDDALLGRGPLFAPYQRGETYGTVAIYERRASGWALRRFVKADSPNTQRSFGTEVALSQNGHVLAVGSPYDPSNASGIDGDREDISVRDRGAVWLY